MNAFVLVEISHVVGRRWHFALLIRVKSLGVIAPEVTDIVLITMIRKISNSRRMMFGKPRKSLHDKLSREMLFRTR